MRRCAECYDCAHWSERRYNQEKYDKDKELSGGVIFCCGQPEKPCSSFVRLEDYLKITKKD